jgi:hypothetical protein
LLVPRAPQPTTSFGRRLDASFATSCGSPHSGLAFTRPPGRLGCPGRCSRTVSETSAGAGSFGLPPHKGRLPAMRSGGCSRFGRAPAAVPTLALRRPPLPRGRPRGRPRGGRGGAEAGAPVADAGPVVGDQAGASLALGGVVQVGASCSLGALVGAFAVGTAGLAPDAVGAVEAAAEQGPAHRGLRLRRRRRSCAQDWQRSPGPTNGRRQPRQ